jgi:hypothetical protein
MAYVVVAQYGIKAMGLNLNIPYGGRLSGEGIPSKLLEAWIDDGVIVDEAEAKNREPEQPAEIEATDTAVELAAANGVNLSTVTGTGKDGRVTVGDVRNAIAGQGDADDTQ